MLPHFPKAYEAMQRTFYKAVFDALWDAAPMLRQIRCQSSVEGNSTDYEREDGAIVEGDPQIARVAHSVRYENATGLSPEAFFELAEELGRKTGEQMERQLFETMSKITDETGNIVAIGPSGEMTFQHWLELNTKIMTDFGDDGEPHTRHLICTPEFHEKLASALVEWEADPEKAARMQAVMQKHKEAYDAREARRRLVD